MPFRAETARGYLQGVQQLYLDNLAASKGRPGSAAAPATVSPRFRYNQGFESVNSLVPTTMALLLAMIPAIMMALSIVREKEFGSVTNLYVTPVTRAEFVMGKQMPYVALAMTGFLVTTLLATLLFGVPIKGSLAALVAGTLIYVHATTAYGLLVSVFASTQIAALFGTALLTIIPATQFSGTLSPVPSLSGAGAVGLFLATLVKSMPQFGLLFMLVFLPMQMLPGGDTPVESEPRILQAVMAGAVAYRQDGRDQLALRLSLQPKLLRRLVRKQLVTACGQAKLQVLVMCILRLERPFTVLKFGHVLIPHHTAARHPSGASPYCRLLAAT